MHRHWDQRIDRLEQRRALASLLYLQTKRANEGSEPIERPRTLQGVKANYEEPGGKIDLEWERWSLRASLPTRRFPEIGSQPFVMSVPDAHLLFAVHRADARIHVRDLSRQLPAASQSQLSFLGRSKLRKARPK
jgi:hypothetical protein